MMFQRRVQHNLFSSEKNICKISLHFLAYLNGKIVTITLIYKYKRLNFPLPVIWPVIVENNFVIFEFVSSGRLCFTFHCCWSHHRDVFMNQLSLKAERIFISLDKRAGKKICFCIQRFCWCCQPQLKSSIKTATKERLLLNVSLVFGVNKFFMTSAFWYILVVCFILVSSGLFFFILFILSFLS